VGKGRLRTSSSKRAKGGGTCSRASADFSKMYLSGFILAMRNVVAASM